MSSAEIRPIITLLIFLLSVTFSQQQVEVAKCTQYKQDVFETFVSFLPLVSAQVDEVRIKVDRCKQLYSPFVVGGVKAEAKEFPESARIGRKENNNTIWFCGGTLISDKFILTAAHCLFSEHGEVNIVRLGDLDFDSTTDNAQPEDFGVRRIIPHPEYDWSNQLAYNDIGLIELNRTVKFNVYKLPACLPAESGDEEQNYIAIGWGAVRFTGPEASHLQKVGLERFNRTNCARFVNELRNFNRGLEDESQICAGSQLQKDTCNGDSGGPLLKYHPTYKCMHVIVGITSSGISGCATPGTPSIYTRVRHYIKWINGIVFP